MVQWWFKTYENLSCSNLLIHHRLAGNNEAMSMEFGQ